VSFSHTHYSTSSCPRPVALPFLGRNFLEKEACAASLAPYGPSGVAEALEPQVSVLREETIFPMTRKRASSLGRNNNPPLASKLSRVLASGTPRASPPRPSPRILTMAATTRPPLCSLIPRTCIRRGSTGGVSRLVLPQQSSPRSFPRLRIVGARAVATDAGTVSNVAGDGHDTAPEDQPSPTTAAPPAPACHLAVRPAWVSELACRLPARFPAGPT